MYDELVKRLRDDEAWKNCDFDFIYSWMHEAADAIEELSDRDTWKNAACELAKILEKYRWIPVTERLPEESDGTVFVCFPDVPPYNLKEPYVGAKHNQRVQTGHYSQFSKTWYIGDFGGVGGTEPIAWMPMPEPLKETNNEL